MPARFGTAVAGTRTVRVLLLADRRLPPFVHHEDWPWLAAYMHEELSSAGVECLQDVELEGSTEGSQDSAGGPSPRYTVEWDFTQQQWVAAFLAGSLQGKSAVCAEASFTKAKYLQATGDAAAAVQYEDASRSCRREAMRRYLVLKVEEALAAAGA